jgi:hypothetical protein
MNSSLATDALKTGRRLELQYDGYIRVVEVHAVGSTRENNEIMRVWQVRGGSAKNESSGWKLLRLDEAISARIIEERSDAPRTGYRQNDRAMSRIYAQL